MARDYYGILGVDPKATDQELKRAYRKLARELHPDVNPDEEAQQRFRDVTTAYEVLTDPEKRRIVDLGGDPMESGGGGGGFGGGFGGFGGGGLGDVFEAFFGGGGGGAGRGPIPRVRAGDDALLRMKLDLVECATGVTKEVTVDTAVLCDGCHGSGCEGDSKPETCTTCRGAGHVQMVQRSMLGNMMTTRVCPSCAGLGEVIPNPCRKCAGDGRVRSRRTINVKVPAGVGGGMRIRLAGQGEVGPGGGPAGDLYVEVIERPHDVFTREGEHLHVTVRVPMVHAALGTEVTLESVTGEPVVVEVPAGTQPGTEIRLRGEGLPRLRDSSAGDLIAHVEVVVPTRTDRHEKELLEKLRDRHGEEARVVSADSDAEHRGGMFSRIRDAFSGR